MIKNILLIIGLFISSAVSAQFTVTIQWHNIKPGNNGDTIYYVPGKKLAWRDFKGRPVAASPKATGIPVNKKKNKPQNISGTKFSAMKATINVLP